jgi:tRNA pseudouridine38-40 synthase
MTRYKLIIEYDGTNFCGWQRQKDKLSVQEVIETAIKTFSNQQITVHVSGRTDAGVHALGQVMHFDLEGDHFSSYNVMNAMNFYLRPQPIVVLECQEIDTEFHARFSAKERHYKYIILNRVPYPTLKKNRVWHVIKKLDINDMQEAANHLIGKHDFSSFRAKLCQASSPIKTLNQIKISAAKDEITFIISAQSFLHHMVRNIVGTLKLVGEGKITPIEVKTILEAQDRKKAGATAPACGLYLERIDY